MDTDAREPNQNNLWALVPGVEKELIKATRKFELDFVSNPENSLIDFDDFLARCRHIKQPAARIRSLSRIIPLYLKIFPNAVSHYQKQNMVQLVSNWVKSHPQTAIMCYCSKIMMRLKPEFREDFIDFRDFIIYQQPHHSKGVQSIIRNYLQ